jgi:hypothetical protein
MRLLGAQRIEDLGMHHVSVSLQHLETYDVIS